MRLQKLSIDFKFANHMQTKLHSSFSCKPCANHQDCWFSNTL